jgi:hypothetical protein
MRASPGLMPAAGRFIMLAGFFGTGSACMRASRIFAIVLIVLGAVLLAQKRGYMPDFGPLFHAWWPLLLVIAGIVLLVRKR